MPFQWQADGRAELPVGRWNVVGTNSATGCGSEPMDLHLSAALLCLRGLDQAGSARGT